MIYPEVDDITGFGQVVFRMSYETINLEKMEKSCPACEEYAEKHSVSPPRIAIMACEGSCAKGEVARQAANLIAHRLACDKTVRICLGGAFTKDSGQRDLVRRADKVIAIEGCFIDCSSRMMKSVIPDLQPTVVRADRLYDAKLPFGVDEVPHEMLVIHAGEVAKKVVKDYLNDSPCSCSSPITAKACDGGQPATNGSANPCASAAAPTVKQNSSVCCQPKDVLRATWDGKSSFTARNANGAEITLGGSGKTLNAVDGLLASLGACVGQSTIVTLGERGCKPEAVEVAVDGQRRTTPPTSFESLHLALTIRGNLEEQVVAECVEKAITIVCPVATTLSKAVRLTWEHRIVR